MELVNENVQEIIGSVLVISVHVLVFTSIPYLFVL